MLMFCVGSCKMRSRTQRRLSHTESDKEGKLHTRVN
jgi:hypothetical protein